jgi:AcrR family transcriptional regulator
MSGSPPADAEPDRFEPGTLSELPPELALGQLPAGRHGLPRSFVERNQRLRLIGAMLRVLPCHGYPQTTIGHVIEEAGVSRSAFYGQFEGKEECFLATYDISAEWLCGRVEVAASKDEEWPARVHAGVSETMRLLVANSDVAHLIAIEVPQAGQAARRRRQACVKRLADALRAGRPEGSRPPAVFEELLVGGTLSLIARDLDAGRIELLPDATADLVSLYFLK